MSLFNNGFHPLPSLTRIRSMSLLFFILTLGAFPPVPLSAQATPPPCQGPESRDFDFWLGDWTVFTTAGEVAGENRIQKALNGCVLHEQYSTPSGYAGESFNIFDASRGVWHQSWVDVAGTHLVLEGGLRDQVMILEGETRGPAGPVRQRISWSVVDNDPNRVRQFWESSTDGGITWTVIFDGLYVRK